MTRFADITGRRFGRWTVASRAPNTPDGGTRWHCVCDCGTRRVVYAGSLKSGVSPSCGCLSKEHLSKMRYVHGMSRTPEYRAWRAMISRCTNVANKMYYRYGGRGISVCPEWGDFVRFHADMGNRPSPKHTLERRDNNGNYEPSNCTWATRKHQSRNRNCTRDVVYRGTRMPVSVAIEMAATGVKRKTVTARLDRGWPTEEALETPPGGDAPKKRVF